MPFEQPDKEVRRSSDVQHYSSKEKSLKHSQVHKAKKLIELNKIEYDKFNKCFLCQPIEGYNKTTYEMRPCKENQFGFECNCQGWQTSARKEGKANAGCSHVLALHYWFDLQNQRYKRGKYKEE